jgi:uncharacterized repeat protein (TIGR03803 family)
MQVSNSIPQVHRVAACGWTKIFAAFLVCAVLALPASAQTFVILHSFIGGTEGYAPDGPLVQGFDGKFYGVTGNGGTGSNSGCGTAGCGTVYGVGRYGKLTTLYSFCSQSNCPDGYGPYSRLAEGPYGTLYGVTSAGGVNSVGTAFKITPGGSFATLHSFCSQANCDDGAYPWALVEGWDGNLHGTTQISGVGAAGGTVFKLSTGGQFSATNSFVGLSTYDPDSLIQGTDGNLYGTASGGNNCCAGIVFKVGPNGLSVIYAFCAQSGCPDGEGPSVTQAADGNLYGVTGTGGGGANAGTFFKLTPDGTLTTLYHFCTLANCADGEFPAWPPIQATDGNFYGITTQGGGSSNSGTIYRITLDGTLTTVHSFSASEGGQSWALTQGTDGAIYGATPFGGTYNRGTIFRLDVGLGPFVQPVLTFGKVGARVTILGTNLTGATAVSFNGMPTTFKVFAPTQIVTSVPAGATTGSITVTLPSGTLTSNVGFTVLP